MRVATLGPGGTYSEAAFRKYLDKEGIKPDDFRLLPTIYKVFSEVERGESELGLVPIENMLNGSVIQTLDKLYSSSLYIVGEVYLAIKHCLASKGNLDELQKVVSHEQAIEQCSNFLEEFDLPVEKANSTADAALIASEDSRAAAICSEGSAEKYGLEILREEIGNYTGNLTRFFVVAKESQGERSDARYKTSLVINPKADRSGLLMDILSAFKLLDINLTKLESRPNRRKFGEYMFYIDAEGHVDDEELDIALKAIKKKINPEIKVLGSYKEDVQKLE